MTDFSQADTLGLRCLRCKSVNLGAEKCPGSPNWWAQLDRARARNQASFFTVFSSTILPSLGMSDTKVTQANGPALMCDH